jgi:hypothetical protein
MNKYEANLDHAEWTLKVATTSAQVIRAMNAITEAKRALSYNNALT